MGHVADGSHKPVVIPTLEGDHVHTVSPTVAQVPRTGCADETVAAFARFITDGDLAKRALSQSLRRDKALRPCLLIEWTGGAPRSTPSSSGGLTQTRSPAHASPV